MIATVVVVGGGCSRELSFPSVATKTKQKSGANKAGKGASVDLSCLGCTINGRLASWRLNEESLREKKGERVGRREG